MKQKLFYLIIGLIFNQAIHSQSHLRYGITGGLNMSTAILPDLTLNTNINSILHGYDVVEGTPQLADFVNLYKAGIFLRFDGQVASAKLSIVYDKTRIYKKIDAGIFRVNALNIDLSYLDIDMTAQLNLLKNFYVSVGYIPAYLLSHQDNLDINELDHRLLAGLGFRFANGITLDFNAILGLTEVIDDSYIHNLIIPITLSIPLNK